MTRSSLSRFSLVLAVILSLHEVASAIGCRSRVADRDYTFQVTRTAHSFEIQNSEAWVSSIPFNSALGRAIDIVSRSESARGILTGDDLVVARAIFPELIRERAPRSVPKSVYVRHLESAIRDRFGVSLRDEMNQAAKERSDSIGRASRWEVESQADRELHNFQRRSETGPFLN